MRYMVSVTSQECQGKLAKVGDGGRCSLAQGTEEGTLVRDLRGHFGVIWGLLRRDLCPHVLPQAHRISSAAADWALSLDEPGNGDLAPGAMTCTEGFKVFV